ncbi:PRC-barrel domain-containing protein [Nitrosomonas sp. Nm51]|nr:PRC-barrel domain-containing protein [Nitrosomonas sp. Nm51]
MDVVNNNGEKRGKISNLILSSPPDSVLFAIMPVGGFLGIDAKLVTVPVDNFKFKNNKAALDASEEELKEAPVFYYVDPAKNVPNLIGIV